MINTMSSHITLKNVIIYLGTDTRKTATRLEQELKH